MRYTLINTGVACLLIFGACQKTAPSNDVENLPELPPDLAATLDPNTMATKTPAANPAPVKPPNVLFAPCCSSTQTRTMQVNYSYTHCGILPDILTRVPNVDFARAAATPLGSGATPSAGTPSIKAFKLTSFNSKTLAQKMFCFTSQGPWNATFIEQRQCTPITPQDTLIINAFGDQVIFQWSGGTPNHPPSVQVISCRDIGTTKANCGISNCDCSNEPCASTQPCNCNLQGW